MSKIVFTRAVLLKKRDSTRSRSIRMPHRRDIKSRNDVVKCEHEGKTASNRRGDGRRADEESESREAVKTPQVLIAETRRSPDGDYDVLDDVVPSIFEKHPRCLRTKETRYAASYSSSYLKF